ncbi:hypothetical protein [Paenibacillus sp. LjRoot56]|uniref:hypothetical protein n=1 Tax=Paenibacillus sp. LjRoot56 TaxID=3342333 RepID=UPI003F4FE364
MTKQHLPTRDLLFQDSEIIDLFTSIPFTSLYGPPISSVNKDDTKFGVVTKRGASFVLSAKNV